MGRVKSYYHDLLMGGEYENVPAEYLLTREEIIDFTIDKINLELAEIADQDKLELDINSI